jgi:hypothetical protein
MNDDGEAFLEHLLARILVDLVEYKSCRAKAKRGVLYRKLEIVECYCRH